jgi:predicted phosphodiesterase
MDATTSDSQMGTGGSGPVAIISDIHANLEALTAVLEDIKRRALAQIICLGDVVGYGPDPVRCAELAMDFAVTLKGNHDEAVVSMALGFNPLARHSIDWTRKLMKPGLFSSRQRKRTWEFLKNLPLSHRQDDVLYVHGSPRDPTSEYILKTDAVSLTGAIPPKLAEIFELLPRVCFVGHTHEPGIFTREPRFLTPEEVNSQYHLPATGKLIVNVGSVGQPRDGDNRACYVTFDGSLVRFHRVSYDVEKTIAKMRQIPRIDDRLCERLKSGR